MTTAGRWMAGLAAGAIWLCAPPARAQDDAGARILDEITACRAIAAPAERLACFDKAAGALVSAVEKKDVRLVDRSDVRRARRSLFGFALPRIDLFGGGRDEAADRDAFTEINTTVAAAAPLGNGRVQIVLVPAEGESGGGAVWSTTDPMNFPPKRGAKIRIRQGALGNYFLNVEGRTYRGTRLR